ncbi:MAG: hypothetical protein WD535_05995 [Thermaerobacterales bacterium]
MNTSALLVFEGGHPLETGKEERFLLQVRRAALLDLLEDAVQIAELDPVILATDDRVLAVQAGRLGVRPELDQGADFHFGRRLAALTEPLAAQTVIYMGGGACPLIRAADLRQWHELLQESAQAFLVNNPMSPDIIGFHAGSIVRHGITLPDADNKMALTLKEGGLARILIPHSARIHFDLDTPGDALLLSTLSGVGKRTGKVLETIPWDAEPLQAVRRIFTRDSAELFLAGRVGPSIITFLNQHFKIRIRVLGEERGMKALGREEQGHVRSLLADWLAWDGSTTARQAGLESFFRALAATCDAALIDTRVLFAHGGRRVSPADRFASDVGDWSRIHDPKVRAFTRAALDAPLPVVLGGHSLVSGGLWALAADYVMPER